MKACGACGRELHCPFSHVSFSVPQLPPLKQPLLGGCSLLAGSRCPLRASLFPDTGLAPSRWVVGLGNFGGFVGGSIAPLPPSHVLPCSWGPLGHPTDYTQVPSGAETLGSAGDFLCPRALARLGATWLSLLKLLPPPQKGPYGLDVHFKRMVFLLVLWAPWVVLDFAGAPEGTVRTWFRNSSSG